MKKIIGGSIALLIMLSSIFTVSAYHEVDHAIQSASEYDYPPFSIVDENDEADGFSVELLRAAVNAMWFEIEFYVGPWSEVKEALVVGDIEVLPLVGRTPEREEVYDFTFPYMSLHGAIFVRGGEKGIETVEDLGGKEVLVMAGDNAEEYAIREEVSEHIISVETYEEAFQLLSEGEHDAVIAQELMGLMILQDLEIKNVEPLSGYIDDFKQDFTFAVQEGDDELLAVLNEGLSLVIANGTYDELYEKWFGPLIPTKVKPMEVAKYVILITVPLFIIFALGAIIILQIQVKRRTRSLEESREKSEEAAESLGLALKESEANKEELKKLNKVMTCREIKMSEMKKEINELKKDHE